MISPSRYSQLWKIAATVIVASSVYFFLPESCPEPARRTAFIFVIAAAFWAFEIIPLYSTSVLVVVLSAFLLCRAGGVLDMDSGGYKVFLMPFASPVIMLFFGGFILAAALHKYRVDVRIAQKTLSLLGVKPYFIMLGFMISTAFLSMWISNTATTALMLVMIKPFLDKIEHDDPFRTGLVLSVAFAANIGGIGTPVGTPPNAIAIGILLDHGIHVHFLSWMLMALPLAAFLILVTSVVLFIMFRPRHKIMRFEMPPEGPLTKEAKGVIGIAILTIVLWLTSGIHKTPEALVAILAVGFLSTSGLLDKNDFKNIDWDILVLMWGGLALGTAMDISGLTNWLVKMPVFGQEGVILLVIFAAAALFLSTFMSNTATANLLLPIAISLQGDSGLMLAVIVALSCSFAMALPISTPPNAMAFGTEAIKSKDMLKSGIVVATIAMTLLAFVGYRWVIPFAFGLQNLH